MRLERTPFTAVYMFGECQQASTSRQTPAMRAQEGPEKTNNCTFRPTLFLYATQLRRVLFET